MRRRHLIALLALVAAVAVAIPATGADNSIKKALGLSKKADKRSKRALKAAQTPTFQVARATGSFSTDSDDLVPAPDGPSVKVTVPGSGLIEVVASAVIDEDAGVVSLYEDGQQVPDQSQLCGPGLGALFQSPDGVAGTFGTPATPGVFGCSSNGAPSPVFFARPPGEHTYELRYAEGCPCQTASFNDRRLWISPRP